VVIPDDIQEQWRHRYADARDFMRSRHHVQRALIEVAAQHPLTPDGIPGVEFRARLDRSLTLFRELRDQGLDVEIYVPGSRHHFDGHDDPVSLSSAGNAYLRDFGMPEEHLHGDDLNERYKGAEGVYGSADECFVAAGYFVDGNFGRLFSVLSPNQMLRKTLHYLAFGVVPLNVTAPVDEPYHDFLYELFEATPEVLLVDSSLQGENSMGARRLRSERKPES
jgi:hypothetical protein